MGCVFIFSGAGCGLRAARTRPRNAEDAKIQGGQKHRCLGSWEAIGRTLPDLPHFLGPCLRNRPPPATHTPDKHTQLPQGLLTRQGELLPTASRCPRCTLMCSPQPAPRYSQHNWLRISLRLRHSCSTHP